MYRINKKGRVEFGLVLENAEYVTSEEEDEVSLNVPQWDRMKRGHVRVAWHPKGREEVLSEKKVRGPGTPKGARTGWARAARPVRTN